MTISRREFTTGAIGLVAAAPFATPLFAQTPPAAMNAAIDAIRSHAEAHMRYFGLPGMTLGLTAPGGFSSVLNFGYANAEARTIIGPDTLFQIGSISKMMTTLVIHQLASEGRLRLDDRVSSIVPEIPLPTGNTITIQHLIDHVAGLADSPPTFAPGGLWTAYAPGAHWVYSNTGYDILGKIAERAGGKTLAQLLQERIFAPLGMSRTRGAIIGADRELYAQGYEAADMTAPFVRGSPLEPAAWVDVTAGSGSVASTADDMMRFTRALADAAQGRGGLGLSVAQGLAFTQHAVPSDTAGMRYGNGLMHVTNAGRSYLHHTGGMVSFSSSLHLDTASGTGAFASSTITGLASYRPRLLTRFAADALTHALAGKPVPAPPPLGTPLPNARVFAGRYSGPSGSFEVAPAGPLRIVAGGQSAALEPAGGDLFRTLHPQFRAFTLKFERTRGLVTGASWGPASFVKQGTAGTLPKSNPILARLAGRYINDSPWWGASIIVERGGRLWLGTELPLTPIADNLWRVGEESWSPERASFADFIDGRPQTFIYSGERFLRHDV